MAECVVKRFDYSVDHKSAIYCKCKFIYYLAASCVFMLLQLTVIYGHMQQMHAFMHDNNWGNGIQLVISLMSMLNK